MASPSAVPVAGAQRGEARCVTRSRSCVGGTASTAREPNEMSPTRYLAGTLRRNSAASALAAASRDGFTSVALIEREVSTASITVASWRRTETVAWGRATPSTIAATASSSTAITAGGSASPASWSTRLGSSAGLPKRSAACVRRCAKTM